MKLLLGEHRLVYLLFEVGIGSQGIVVDVVAFLPIHQISVPFN